MASAEALIFHSASSEATGALAERIGQRIEAGTVLCIDGDLGAGKTLFVKGLARGLEVEECVDSPTFTLMNQYRGRLELFHFDAWMQGRERAFLEGGGEEFLHAHGVTAIEWGGRVLDLLPRPLIWIEMAHRSPTEREISMRLVADSDEEGRDSEERLARLLEALARDFIHTDLHRQSSAGRS